MVVVAHFLLILADFLFFNFGKKDERNCLLH